MSWIVEPERKTPVASEAEVLVCGGGGVGVAAAVCAARRGARVLLVERYGFLGGISPNMHEVRTTKFADTVAKPYAEDTIRLPLGSLLPQGVENLLVAGRCISAEEEAMGHLRLIPVCSATGEAAGTAAALAVRTNTTPSKLDVAQLQAALTAQGVDLGL